MPPPDTILGKRSKPSTQSQDFYRDDKIIKKTNNVYLSGSQANLRDYKMVPFTQDVINQAIKDLAKRVLDKQSKMGVQY
jgi:hypothetical protein